MKKAVIVALSLILGVTAQATQLAFPGAEGYGCYAAGGRGGDVYHVTTLADYNDWKGANEPNIPGSLRYGLRTATGPRTIVFDVSGYINLKARLEFGNHYITIAGQTAPGDGITLRHWDVRLYQANNAIVRYIRVRPGYYADQVAIINRLGTDPNHLNGGLDCLSIEGSTDIIVDHCSLSWGADEIGSVTGDSNDVTVQWTYYTEPLEWDSHAYCPLMRPAMTSRLTHHHNLYADCKQRLTRFGNYNQGVVVQFDWVNNVGYNWKSQTTYSDDNGLYWDYVTREGGTLPVPPETPDGEWVNLNFIRNYFIKGPSSGATGQANSAYDCTGRTNPIHRKVWGENNYWDPDKDANSVDGYDAGWTIITPATGGYTKMTERFPITGPLKIDTAPVAYDRVLAYGGNWLVRDAVDTRNINEVITRTGAGNYGFSGSGILITQDDTGVGGFPTLAVESRDANTFDTDGDGMPTAWEEARWWLDPNDPNDRNIVRADGYTNLEKYLNYLVLWRGTLKGDINNDSKVDYEDLAAFLEDWLVEDDVYVPVGDLYGDDHFVDWRDFAVFAAGWTGP